MVSSYSNSLGFICPGFKILVICPSYRGGERNLKTSQTDISKPGPIKPFKNEMLGSSVLMSYGVTKSPCCVLQWPTSVRGFGRRSSANWWWQSSQWLLLEAVSQCSRQDRCTMARLPEHSQGDSSSPEDLPSWQILQNGSSLCRLAHNRQHAVNIHM